MIRADMKSDTGRKRASNQDCAFYTCQRIGSFSNLFVVADGMGGHQAGDFASAFAVERFVDYIRKRRGGLPAAVLQEAFSYANKELFRTTSSDEKLHGAGTTMVAMTALDGIVYAANVGDSRLYGIRGDEIVQITHDHSYVEELVALGTITRGSEEYRRCKNLITRAIGARNTVTADLFEVGADEYSYFLLCTDGLTNMIPDDTILEIINKDISMEEKTGELITLANEHGGFDNITALLVRI